MAKRLTVLTLCLALAPLIAACGEKKDVTSSPAGGRQPFTVMLDWVPNADHVGLYDALARGDFAKVGIDPRVEVPSDPAAPLQLLAAGKIDAAISYEPEVMLARNRGLALVSVAAIVQRPLTSIISLGSKHITSVGALRGKRVGDAGIGYQHAYLDTILSHAGIPPSKVSEANVGANLVPAMLSGRVDATLGGYWNYEAVQLQQAGKRPNVIRMEQVGVPTYDELVLVVRRSTLTGHTDLVRRFVQALARGYEAARADPGAAVAALLKANPGLGRQLQQAAVRASLPAFFPGGGQPWGWQNPARWNAYGQWMMNNHLISNPQAIADASTNELLPGRGP